MIKQILLLTKLEIRNIFNINVVLNTNVKKEKLKLIAFGFIGIFVSVMMLAYLGMMCYGIGQIGLAGIIPVYLFISISMVILFLSVFKATHTLFNHGAYEILAALPIRKSSIVISRFIGMYMVDLLISFGLMIMGLIVYNMFIPLNGITLIYILIGTMFLPLLPLVIATIISLLLAVITSRLKYKSIVYSIISFIFIGVVYAASFMFSSNVENLDMLAITDAVSLVSQIITNIYFPASWFLGAINGSLLDLLVMIIIPSILFIIMISLFAKHYDNICNRLKVKVKKQEYKLKELDVNSPLKALVAKEIKRYFDSSIYVVNTMTGFVIMVAIPIVLAIFGIDKFGVLKDTIVLYYPLFVSASALMMPTTSASISIEGKNWWLVKSLPIDQTNIYLSKVLVNLIIATPFYILTVVLSIIFIPLSFMGVIQLIIFPPIIIVLSSLVGLFINLKYPVFKWDNEVKVVKQGVSVLFTMLIDFILMVIFIGVVYFIGSNLFNLGMLIDILFGLIGSYLLWKLICKVDITKIN